MNTSEMLKAVFKEGKKARRDWWSSSVYIKAKGDTLVMVKEHSESTYYINSFSDDWELYIEDTRKELPKGIKHIEKLYELMMSKDFQYCNELHCSDCPLQGNIKPTKCSMVLIRDFLRDLDKEYKIEEK